MKSLQIGLGVAALALVGVAPAHASELYAKVGVGQTENASVGGIDLTGDTAYTAGIGTGLGPLRVEGAVSHVSGHLSTFADISAYDYQATAYLDVPITQNSGVFAGVGADYVSGTATAFGSSMDANGKGWHYTVGVAHRFAPGLIGEVSYTKVSADVDTPYGSQNADFSTAMASLRVAL